MYIKEKFKFLMVRNILLRKKFSAKFLMGELIFIRNKKVVIISNPVLYIKENFHVIVSHDTGECVSFLMK